MEEKCALCGRNRAVRFCPAIGKNICSLCCGRSRNRTIDCPDECRFLKQAREQALLKLVALGERDLEIAEFDVLHNFRLALVRVRRNRVHDLTEAEMKQALANAADTLRTKSKGLIYEFRSHNPRVQFATDELTAVAERHEKGDKGFRRVESGELAHCLRYLRHQAEDAIEREVGFFELTVQAVGRNYISKEES